ncbi:MAG: glycosyltransferase family 4 protein [bacterium]|nr:glycosyltransferase family 4 protein [bacterium]
MIKIKVLFTIGNLDIGGAEKLIINQVKNIDRERFEPHLCTLFSTGQNNYSDLLSRSLNTPYHEFYFKGPWDVVNWIKVFLLLRREKFDIFCCHLFESNFIIRVANLFTGAKPVFIFEHNIYWQKQWWKILADRFLVRKTAKIFVDSHAILNFTSEQEKIDKNKFAILPYPIELTDQKNFDRARIKKDLGLPPNSFVIGSVARFVQQKGQIYLIKAAAKILNEIDRQDIYFLLVGYGKMEAELRDLVDELKINSKVIISSAKDIKNILPVLDIFVISSLWEGQPIAMLEAMAAGCPVVATKVGGVPEAITEGKNGLLAEPKDSDSLASKITRLVEDNKLRDSIAKEGVVTAQEYGMPVYIKKLEKYFIDEFKSKNK